jgi:hypothetical protein
VTVALALGWRPFWFLGHGSRCFLDTPLLVCFGAWVIQLLAWLAVVTGVSKLFTSGFLAVVRVEALDMLPRVADFAVYCVAIVSCESAYALYGIGLLVCSRFLLSETRLARGCVVGGAMMRGDRRGERAKLFRKGLRGGRRRDGIERREALCW